MCKTLKKDIRFFIKCHEVYSIYKSMYIYFFFDTFKIEKKDWSLYKLYFLIQSINKFLFRTNAFESMILINFIVKFC